MMHPSQSEYDSFRVGANVFLVRDSKLLLGRRKNIFGDGTWALPGGHLETGESMTGAAKRELDEETGLIAKGMKFVALVNNVQDNGHYIQVGFLAEGVEGEPQLKEPDKCYEWKWYDLDQLPDTLFIGHQRLIQIFLDKKVFEDSKPNE